MNSLWSLWLLSSLKHIGHINLDLQLQLDLNYWPGQFTSNGMQPGISGDIINTRRQANIALGNVTINITWHTQN